MVNTGVSKKVGYFGMAWEAVKIKETVKHGKFYKQGEGEGGGVKNVFFNVFKNILGLFPT
jgi:hypothetical protein